MKIDNENISTSKEDTMPEPESGLPRRAVLKGAVAGSIALGLGLPAPVVAESSSDRKTFVLVHGAWHGGWCWTRVRDILEALGHRVFTPTLTGLAENSHRLTADVDLNTHIKDIENLFWWENLENVTLVGHSYAGWVCSGALEAIEKQVSSFILVDAFVPEDGTSAYDTNNPQQQAGLDTLRANGVIERPPIPAEAFRVKSPEDIAWVNEKMTPQPVAAAFTKIRLTGARERIARKSYIRALGFPMPVFQNNYETLTADPNWETHAVPADLAGHDIMVDAPDLLADLIENGAA